MSVYHVAAGSIVIVSGLLLASALFAAQGTEATPVAQMNRDIYPTIYVPRYVPRHAARHAVAKPVSAQMNRAAYQKAR